MGHYFLDIQYITFIILELSDLSLAGLFEIVSLLVEMSAKSSNRESWLKMGIIAKMGTSTRIRFIFYRIRILGVLRLIDNNVLIVNAPIFI